MVTCVGNACVIGSLWFAVVARVCDAGYTRKARQSSLSIPIPRVPSSLSHITPSVVHAVRISLHPVPQPYSATPVDT